jgi:Tetracyclin repressor-like, C-terminal domain
VLRVLSAADEQSETLALEQRVARFVDGVIAAHSIDQALHHVLVDEVPLGARSSYVAFEAEYQRRYQALLAAADGRGGDDGEGQAMASRMLSSAVEGVVHSAAGRNELGAAAFRTELVRLILAYLRDRGAMAQA